MKKDMEKQNDISEVVLAKIHKEHLTPQSRWRFLFHDYLIWAVSAFSLAVGSLSFGLFLTIILGNDWDIYDRLEESRMIYSLSVIPYLWIVFVAFFAFYASYSFRNTDNGYRHRQANIAIGSIAISAIFGVLLYYTGVAQDTDDFFVSRVPCYHEFTGHSPDVWNSPERGFLAGRVASTTDGGLFVTDIHGNTWKIIGAPQFENGIATGSGAFIKIFGDRSDNNIFFARHIRQGREAHAVPLSCGTPPPPPPCSQKVCPI